MPKTAAATPKRTSPKFLAVKHRKRRPSKVLRKKVRALAKKQAEARMRKSPSPKRVTERGGQQRRRASK